jgi:quercetin dioxygenase-like cupin family protein
LPKPARRAARPSPPEQDRSCRPDRQHSAAAQSALHLEPRIVGDVSDLDALPEITADTGASHHILTGRVRQRELDQAAILAQAPLLFAGLKPCATKERGAVLSNGCRRDARKYRVMTLRHNMNRTVAPALAVLFLGSAIVLLRAQTPAALPEASSKLLMQTSVGDAVDTKMTLASLFVAGGSTLGAHSHQGPVLAYILEGNIENQVDPDPPKTYRSGDFFHAPPMHLHRLLRNPSSTEPARLLTFTVGATGTDAETSTTNPDTKTLLAETAHVANRELRVSILTLPGGWWGAGREGVGAHQHPGPIVAYILKGVVESQVDPGSVTIYRAGEFFYEPQMHAHRLFRNVSHTEPADLLMFQIFDKDRPTATAVK